MLDLFPQIEFTNSNWTKIRFRYVDSNNEIQTYGVHLYRTSELPQWLVNQLWYY